MNNNKEISYFKIGTFVLVGFGLIIFSLLIFGSGKLFQRLVYVETYFEESIQGISEGTPVKYRGLQVGYIKKISFTSEIYKDNENLNENDKKHSRSIYVKIAITSKLFTRLSDKEVMAFFAKEVVQGLRIRLVAQGLTGSSYLEFDYVDPKENPLSKVTWNPMFFHVPAVTSTLTRLSENAQYIVNELKDVNFKGLFLNLDKLTTSLTRVANKTEVLLNQVDSPAIRTLQNLKIISDNLRLVSNRVKLKPSEIIFSTYPPILDPKKI